MELLIICSLLGLGIVFIVKGGDFFVDAAAWMAEVSGIPKMIVGATIVSIATTLPEILVSAMAAFSGKAEIAVGNAVGSVTANLGLIFATCAIFCPFRFARRAYAVKGMLMLLSIGTLYAFSFQGSLSHMGAVILAILFVAFMVENLYAAARSKEEMSKRRQTDRREAIRKLADFVVGMLGITGGARLLVDNASKLALRLGVPEGVIAATVVAIGTSLPELVTAVASIVKKQGALSIGNILGANIIDTTLIIPLCGLLYGGALPISLQGLALDLPFCLLIAVVAVIPMLLRSKTTKRQGISLLALYGSYLFLLFTRL